ncbi:putative two-component response regulator [Chondrocystis sp. NIES-4102]|nr:putative two-component response regulator [Chondrocystis sp. NIES-4102]
MIQSLNPVELLTDLSVANNNGKLQITNGKVLWSIYLEQGKIQCAANSVQQLIITLDHHLRTLGFQAAAAATKSIPNSETETLQQETNWLEGGRILPSINWLILQQHLDRNQAQQVFASLTEEAIETFLWIKEGDYKWHKNQSLPQHTLAARVSFKPLAPSALINKLEQRIQAWQSLSTHLTSPYQCPHLNNPDKLSESSAPILSKFAKFLKGLSFRQLGLILNQDELKIAQLLYPYIKSGEITIHPPPDPYNRLPHISGSSNKQNIGSNFPTKYKVACIDDSPTILDEMQRFLGADNYEITRIEDPLKAAPILLRLKPDLILMDISMPNINGYTLCSFFRGSASLKQVPIIMVSGRTGFIDKTRAKMAGATDYLTKPFSRSELLTVVNQYLSPTGVKT